MFRLICPVGTQFSTADITTPTLDLASLFPNLRSSVNRAFANATNVTRFIFPASYASLGESSFANNSNLTVIFGNSIEGSSLATVKWGGVPAKPTVVLYSPTPPNTSYFIGARCYVPDEAVDTYKAAYSSQAAKFYPVSEWPG